MLAINMVIFREYFARKFSAKKLLTKAEQAREIANKPQSF